MALTFWFAIIMSLNLGAQIIPNASGSLIVLWGVDRACVACPGTHALMPSEGHPLGLHQPSA